MRGVHVHRRERGEVSWMLHPTLPGKDGRDGRYLGVLAKGWYAPTHRHSRWPSLTFAIGGEDNMVQVGGGVVFWQGAVGVRIPSRLTRGWVYQRRQWGVKLGYIGSIARLEFAYDDGMDNMHGYYARKAEQIKAGVEPHTPYFPNRVQRWPGWSYYVGGTSIPMRLKNRALGKIEHTKRIIETRRVPIEMDGRVYTGNGTLYDDTSGRGRGKSVTRRYVELEFGPAPFDPPQFAGKGESDYDCGDDGIYGAHYDVTGIADNITAFSEATRQYVAEVEHYRERYGQPSRRAS